MSSIFLALAAYLVMTLHFAFLALVLLGGVLSLRFPRLLPIHIPAFIYAVIIEAIRFPCVVTDFEKYLRVQAGLPSYERGFIGHYIEPHLVTLGLPHLVYANLGYWTVGLNLLLYLYFFRRYVKNRRQFKAARLGPTVTQTFVPILAVLLLASCTPTRSADPAATLPTSRTASVTFPYRMLAIFAESERDLRLDQQRRYLGPIMPILERQGIRLVEVVGSDPLRDLMRVPETDFHVLLIERDATASFQSERPVTPSQFGLILGEDPDAGRPTPGPTSSPAPEQRPLNRKAF